MKKYIFITIHFLLCSPALGVSLFDSTTSVRAMGMGGAYTAVVSDSYSLFYNPAGLAKNTGVHWRIGDLRVGASNEKALSSLTGGGADLSAILQPLYGEPIWTGAGLNFALTFPYFGMIVYDNLNLDLNLENPAYIDLEIEVANDLGVGIGFAFPVIPKFLYTGVNIKRIGRTGGKLNLRGGTLGDPDYDIGAALNNVGVGYSLDLGFNFTFPAPLVTPTFSFVWKDVGLTTFDNVNLPRDDENMIFGAAAEIELPLFTITPSFELRHLTNSDMQLANKIHMGIEFGLPMLDIRGGLNQGYYTLGLGMSLGPLDIELATYGVELGDYPGQLEDRRYVLSFSAEVGIDGVGGIINELTGQGGEGGVGGARRRRLKQRR